MDHKKGRLPGKKTTFVPKTKAVATGFSTATTRVQGKNKGKTS